MAITLTINNTSNPINVNNTGGTITLTVGTGGIALLSQLNDINLTSLTDNQILVYDAASGKWVNENSGGGGGATNLGYTAAPTNGVVTSDTGTDATIPATDGTNAGLFLPSEKTKLSLIEDLADVTDATNVNAAGAVMESDYNVAHSILVQQSGTGTPTVLQVPSSTIVGNNGGGDIVALTASQVRTIINVEDGADVTDSGNVGSVVAGVTEKTTPVDADTMPLTDSAAANALKKVSWANIKATLKSYFDSIYAAIVHTHTAADITDFDTEVSNNTDVAANTSARHDAVTVSDTDDIDFTLTGQQISASIKATAISSKTADTLSGTEEVLVNDAGTLKKTTVQDIADLGGGGGGLDLATVGDSFVYETDFYAQSIPDGLTTHSSGTGSGFSYSNTMVEGHPGFAYPSPGTSAGAFSGRAHICPTVDVGPTSGWTVGAGELDFTFIVQTASLAQSGTEDYFDIFGLSNSFFNPNPDNSVAITRQQGVNSGNWIFRYRTSSNQVTINGSSGSATSTWFVLRFKVAATTHECEFWINGVSQGTGTPATKITATNHAALYLGVAKVASAGGEPRPRWDYFRVQQNLNRN